jgi:hypothetical protein
MSDKILIPSEDYVNAKNIALFINSELSGDKNFLRPDKADNLFDMAAKFEEERNASLKFCLYGKVESKWGDCNNLKIEFKINDTSTNIGTGLTNSNYPFWVYDKTSAISAYTWNFMSKSLDLSNGSLSKNIYGKNKGHYFFPFELDMNSITNSNKSMFVKIYDTIDSLYCIQEFPFIYFNEDGNLLEFGTETAEILDDGTIIEINNNYPFFYDRHWIRREIEPTGPPFVYFSQPSLTFTEGDPYQPEYLVDKIVQFDVALSKPPQGIEKIRLSFVYGQDEDFQEYTTISRQGFPPDIESNFLEIEWNSATASTVQSVSFKINDDYLVEGTERFTLKIIPILGVLPDPEKPQLMSIYLNENDIPSAVFFESQSYQFIEPRQDVQPLIIPITLNLDRNLLLASPEQSVELYIDLNETTCLSSFGFLPDNPSSNNSGYTYSKLVKFNQTDLSYVTNFYFISKRSDDLQTKITLRLRNFTSNVVPGNFNQSNDNKFVLYVDKNIDKNYIQINIPFDKQSGKAVLRSVFNKPNTQGIYDQQGQTLVSPRPCANKTDFITKLQTFSNSSFGNIDANTEITGVTEPSLLKQLVFEDFFKINIKNLGNRILFDGHTYDSGDTLSLDVYSGFSTSVSSGQFIYDGSQFILKLPANENFVYFEGLNTQVNLFGLNLSGASIWGFQKCKYEIEIQNKTYNYIPSVLPTNDGFKATNLLTSKIFFRNNTYEFEESFYVNAGNDNNKQIYYSSTELIDLDTQIEFDSAQKVLNYSSPYSTTSTNNMYFSPNKIYYPGIVIIPKECIRPPRGGGSPPDELITSAQIFLSQEIVGIENGFNTASTTNLNILNFPCSDYTINLDPNSILNTNTFDFGQLLVQCGYYTRGIMTTLFNNQIGNYQQAVPDDSFVVASKYFSSNVTNDIKNGFLYSWGHANPNTKNQAVIEILNDGLFPVKILDLEIQPNSKLWLSEFAIPVSNSNGLVKNIVTPLDQLKLTLPTNYSFMRKTNFGGTLSYDLDINKFTKCKYKISFLNFVLYNESDGLPSNKIVNQSFNTEDSAIIELVGGNVSYPLKNLYLTSIYSSHVFVNHRNLEGYLCDNTILDVQLLSDSNDYNKSIMLHGFIATASQKSPLFSIQFSDIPVSNRGIECDQNGLTWVKSNNTTI